MSEIAWATFKIVGIYRANPSCIESHISFSMHYGLWTKVFKHILTDDTKYNEIHIYHSNIKTMFSIKNGTNILHIGTHIFFPMYYTL